MQTQTLRILGLMFTIVVFGSASHISLPLVVAAYPSVLFVMITCSVEGLIIYGIFRVICGGLPLRELIVSDFTQFKKHYLTVIVIGISNAFMTILMMYSANPVRTPVVIQSVFLGLAVISSIIFSKLFLNKKVIYNYPLAIISIMFLLGSVAIAIVPLIMTPSLKQENFGIGWILMFMFGVFAYSLTNILQEKYIRDSADQTTNNKVFIAFYSSIFQFLTVMSLSWLDIFIGYKIENKTQFDLFIDGFNTMTSDIGAAVVLQVFILLWFLLFVLALFLNEISTNYTMILTNITNQSVALFFIIFPQFNHGIKYPLFITLSSLGTSLVSVLFWINAEKIIDNDVSDEEKLSIIK